MKDIAVYAIIALVLYREASGLLKAESSHQDNTPLDPEAHLQGAGQKGGGKPPKTVVTGALDPHDPHFWRWSSVPGGWTSDIAGSPRSGGQSPPSAPQA